MMICSHKISHTISLYYVVCSMCDLICSTCDLICSTYDVAKKTCYIAEKKCYVVWYVMDLGVPRRVLDYDIIVKNAI